MKRLVPARGWTKWLGGAALGAALLLLSGRQRGLRHLTALQDMKQMKAKEGQETEAGSHERVSGRSGSSGLRRLRMLRVRVAHMLRSGRQIDDVALEEKVHARLKAAASRPSAIQVSVRDGCIVLNGSVGAGEKRQLLDDVASVAGVLKVEDRMRVIENGDGAEPAAGDGRAAERRSNGAGVWGPAVQAA